MKKPDLTEGWPEDRGNEELARFAEGLRTALPELGPEAIARVRATVRRAAADADATGRRSHGRAWAVRTGLAAAACAILAVGAWLAYGHRDLWLPGDVNPPTANGDAKSPAAAQLAEGGQGGPGQSAAQVHVSPPAAEKPAEDTYMVACALPPTFQPDRPLVAMEKYRGLLADR